MTDRKSLLILVFLVVAPLSRNAVAQQPTQQQLNRLLKQYPDADANGDGRLTVAEVRSYRKKLQDARSTVTNRKAGAPRQFDVDPGWQADRFPGHAVSYRSPEEIAAVYAKVANTQNPVTSYSKPQDGSLRIVGTGRSFMAPGYKTFPLIARAAGLDQPQMLTHTGGGMKGSTRYKWEQENGIFGFDGRPLPRLMASIANAKWDAMMWGPYFNDRPEYYECWIDFCLKYNPQMKFYLSDAWPQLVQLDTIPKSEDELTDQVFERMARERNTSTARLVGTLNAEHPGRVFVMPTSDAMVLAVQYFHRQELPGVEGIHKLIGGKDRSLWRDQLGHLGPGLGQLEGYVFYATMYGRSPELIEDDVRFEQKSGYPSVELDRVFRRIAWQAVVNNPLSGVTDNDADGIGDE